VGESGFDGPKAFSKNWVEPKEKEDVGVIFGLLASICRVSVAVFWYEPTGMKKC
jgi:hypothetical protein